MAGPEGLLGPIWRTCYCACCAHRGAVPTGTETACWYHMVSFYACALWVCLLMLGPFYFLTASDGDTVKMCVGADGMKLQICDNHIANEQNDLPAVQE
jgi:hypothetical protein